jgi:hypothetical protein
MSTLKSILYFLIETIYSDSASRSRTYRSREIFRPKRITYSNATPDQAKQLVREHYPRLHVPDVKAFNDVRKALEFLKSTEQLWAQTSG